MRRFSVDPKWKLAVRSVGPDATGTRQIGLSGNPDHARGGSMRGLHARQLPPSSCAPFDTQGCGDDREDCKVTGQRICPDCSAEITVEEGIRAWCERCNWNLGGETTPPAVGHAAKAPRTMSRTPAVRYFCHRACFIFSDPLHQRKEDR